jgi:hypothetical protein
MILEEAYSSNPKPDKQARLDIVQRVSLNEKEVQVWQSQWSTLETLSHHELALYASAKLIFWKHEIDIIPFRFGSRTEDKTTAARHVLYRHKRLLLSNLEA